MSIDKQYISRCVKLLRESNVMPNVVRNIDEARRMTESDPFGMVWRVGEEYYEVRDVDGVFGVPILFGEE